MLTDPITRQELLDSEKRILASARRMIAEALRKPNPNAWLTRKQVLTLLKISGKKLHRLRRRGIVRCDYFGGKLYYDYHQIWRQRKKNLPPQKKQ